MPDEPSGELTPQQRQVRDLLRGARETEPMPDAVTARLDAVLEDLAATGTVVDLHSARGRLSRLMPALVAAAAVVVLGVGVVQISGLPGSSDMASSAGGAADSAMSQPETAPGTDSNQDKLASTSTSPTYLVTKPLRVRSDAFAADVARVQALAGPGADGPAALGGPPADFVCAPADWGVGTWVPVRYDGAPAVLVLRPVVGEAQVADLVGCGNPDVIRSITLPAA